MRDTLVSKHTSVSFFMGVNRMERWVIETVITIGVGVIAYFLKRTMGQVDGHEIQLQKLANDTVTKEESKETTTELKRDIREIRDNYTPKEEHRKDFDECRDDIKHIKSEYLTKDDFIREINKMDRKLDNMDQKQNQILELMISKLGKGE